jgi:hypothetical protein
MRIAEAGSPTWHLRRAGHLTRHPGAARADVLLPLLLGEGVPAVVQATVDQRLGEKLHSVTYPVPAEPTFSVAEMRFFPSRVKATLVELFRGPAGSLIDLISWPEATSNTGAVPFESTSTAIPASSTAGPAAALMSPPNERMRCRPSALRTSNVPMDLWMSSSSPSYANPRRHRRGVAL